MGDYDALVTWDYGQGHCYVSEPFPADKDNFLAVYAFQIKTETFEDTEGEPILMFSDDSGHYILRIFVQDNSGSLKLNVRYHNGTDETFAGAGSTTISLNTWYMLTVDWQRNTSFEVKMGTIGGSLTSQASSVTVADYPGRWARPGSMASGYLNAEAGDAMTFEFDNLVVDDDTLHSLCQ